MEATPKPTEADGPPRPTGGTGLLDALASAITSRIFSGLIVALPLAVTISIIFWLYITLQGIVLDPLAWLVDRIFLSKGEREQLPLWWERILAPLIAISIVLALLYFLGYFVRSRVVRLVDWVMLRLPGVTIIYSAVRNVIDSLEHQRQAKQPQRIVLVPFPHAGARALAMVTKTLRDADTGRTILCVYVMTAIVPPAGFTLFVPEEDVVDIDWTVNEAFQVVLSGGMTAPGLIRYAHGGPTKLIVTGPAPEPVPEEAAPGAIGG